MKEIAVLDISRFDVERDRFVEELGVAYQAWGFAGITGHGIDGAVIQQALQAAEQFFSQPDPVKQQYVLSTGSARGFTPFGIEKARDAKHSDLKEFYHIGREVDGQGENVWPQETPDFQSAFERLYSQLDALAMRILSAMALYLELPEDYFEARVDRGDSILRVLHYPPITDEKIPNLRAAAHEDINLITLLAGSEQAGLEVLSRSGEWIPISMIEGTIVCNVGDMLQRLTNARLPSTTHRVVNPQGDLARTSRYSIPFFMHPNADMSLACLPQCIDEQHPAQFPPTTAGDFLHERLREIGLIK